MGPKSRSRGKATRKLQVIESVQARVLPLRRMRDWVRGYKLTRLDGMSFVGAVQYELGKTYHCTGELEFCHNGLHFSKEALHARHIMPLYNMRKIALWEVRAKPNRLKTDAARDGLAEKSITDELFMERKLSHAECEEKLTGWMHTQRPCFFDKGTGYRLASDDSSVYYYKGTAFAFISCETHGSVRVFHIGLMHDGHPLGWPPFRSRREIECSPETLQKAIAEMRQEVERYLDRILQESKQKSEHFHYVGAWIQWSFRTDDLLKRAAYFRKDLPERMKLIIYRTPFNETHKNFVDFNGGGFSTHVASLEEATALVDRRLATGSYDNPAPTH